MFWDAAQKFGFGDSLEVEPPEKESDIVRVVSLIVENSKKLHALETDIETNPYRDNEELLSSLSSDISKINKLIDEMGVPQDKCVSEYVLNYEDQPQLMELLKKVSEFNKAYPELVELLGTGTPMLGGDEIGAIVIEVGSHTTRCGYAGEDTPKSVFPSDVSVVSMHDGSEERMEVEGSAAPAKRYRVGSQAMSVFVPGAEVVNPMGGDGCFVRNWDVLAHIYNHALSSDLHANPSEHPLLAIEPPDNPRDVRETLTELAFEHFHVPAFFVGKSCVMAAFASGKPTALVVDSGAERTVVSAVHEGYCLKKSLVTSDIAGKFISNEFLKAVVGAGSQVRPRYTFKRRETTPGSFAVTDLDVKGETKSYKTYSLMEIADDIKQSVCEISPLKKSEEELTAVQQKEYSFPDGSSFGFSKERFTIPEVFFDGSVRSVPSMVTHSVFKCDVDIRNTLYQSVIFTGGNSLIRGFVDRLNNELPKASPMFKGKVIAPPNVEERKFASWIGGSILASLGTFHQLWISKQEYDEYGKGIVEKKCP